MATHEQAGPGRTGPPPPVTSLPSSADAAVTELYAAHWQRLVRLAWLLLHDQLAAEDVVQDAFVATHRNWRSIRESGRAVGYLQVAVLNGCRSAQRHAAVVDRDNARRAAAADAPGRDHVSSAEHGALRAAEQAEMMRVLRALPQRQREVLVLRYYADLSEAQIASALEISTGSVKAHAHRGLHALRRLVPGTADPRTSPPPRTEPADAADAADDTRRVRRATDDDTTHHDARETS
ncbi:MAG: SigE family RNA polymerase sigma factor [Terracoccus sp.]